MRQRGLHAERAARLLLYYLVRAVPEIAREPEATEQIVEIVDAIVAAATEEMRAELRDALSARAHRARQEG
jgi:hypothetical protein